MSANGNNFDFSTLESGLYTATTNVGPIVFAIDKSGVLPKEDYPELVVISMRKGNYSHPIASKANWVLENVEKIA